MCVVGFTFKLYCTVNYCTKFTASEQVKYLLSINNTILGHSWESSASVDNFYLNLKSAFSMNVLLKLVLFTLYRAAKFGNLCTN